MREAALCLVLFACATLGVFGCSSPQKQQEVVFIDLEEVISREKKRIFGRVLRGEISREEAEKRVGRFFARFGEVLVYYESRGFLVLEAESVLGGGRDITEEVLGKLSARRETDE